MKAQKISRQRERRGRVAGRPTKRFDRLGGRRDDRTGSLLPTGLFEQLGQDLYEIGEDLRGPVTDLARGTLETAFGVAQAFTRELGDLVEAAIDEAGRLRRNIGRRLQDLQRSPSAS